MVDQGKQGVTDNNVSLQTIACEIKTIFTELKEMQKEIKTLTQEKSKDEGRSEACLIMVMKLEVAFLLVSKLFTDGVVDTFEGFEFTKENLKPKQS